MNKKQAVIIIGVILIISIISIVIIDSYITQRDFESKNTPGQLRGISGLCNCKLDPERTCPEPFIDWQNSTHYIDNNLCEFITLEEYLNNQK